MHITRREFLRMAAYAAAATGASQFDIFKLNKAIADNGVPNVVWFEGLGDSGCVVSLANYFDGAAGIEGVLLNSIDLKFNSVLMGAAGQMAIDAAEAVYNGGSPPGTPYILVLSGAISNLDGYCVVGNDTVHGNGVMQLVESFSKWEEQAAYVLFVGSCACHGGVNKIGGKPSHNDAQVLPPFHEPVHYTGTRNDNYDRNKSLYIPGCPAHPDWIVLSIVHLLTSGMPTRDKWYRPLSLLGGTQLIYDNTVHSQCERKSAHDAGLFADSVGDPEKCMRKVGCRGKETYCDCPTRGWNSVGAHCTKKGINHLCIGCTQPSFADVPWNRNITNIDTTP